MLVLKLEHEKEIEKLKQKTELLKLELEHEKLKCSIDETKQKQYWCLYIFLSLIPLNYAPIGIMVCGGDEVVDGWVRYQYS